MSVNIEKYRILYYNYIVYNMEKNMISINADKPITKSEEDVLGRKKFVENLTNILTSYEDTNSLTIGLYGKWGSGKTSIINLTTTKLKEAKYKVIHFNPWNFKGQDELIQCFFKEFYNQLDMVDYHKLFTKLGNLFKRIGQVLSFGKYVPVISPYATIIAPLIKEYGEALDNLTYKKSLEDIKKKISKALLKLDKKIIIFIDDVDRLSDIEICQIFQLVKLLADFKNVVYILAMDKDVVVSALQNSQREHSEEYIEKIIQLPINVPDVPQLKVQNVLIEKLNAVCNNLNEFLPSRNNDLARTTFWQQFFNLRDVHRYLNVFIPKFEALKKNVDMHDFCIMTLLEIKYPDVRNFIFKNQAIFTGIFYYFSSDDREKKNIKETVSNYLESLQSKYSTDELSFIKECLYFLFPKISQSFNVAWGYTTYQYEEMKIRGFICITENFSNYYQFEDEKLSYSKSDIDNIITNYNKEDFIIFIKQLNTNKELSEFLPYVSYYIENKLTEKRASDVINWLIEFSDDLEQELSEYEAFKVDCDQRIGYMIKKYIQKNREKINVVEFLTQIYSKGKLNNAKVDLLRSLQVSSGKVADGNTKNEKDKIVTIQELETIEQLIKNELTEYLNNKENFLDSNYVQYYYLMKHIDSNICKELTNKVIKDEVDILNFVKNFCGHGQHLTGNGEKTYRYHKSLEEEFDMKKVYDILVKELSESIDLNEGLNLYRAAYVMSYEKGCIDDGYTKREIEQYIKNRNSQ